MTHCPHCGEQLEQEVKRPDGCVCDANEWGDPYNLPAVCDKFEADHIGMNCTRCEHDYECHAEVVDVFGESATVRHGDDETRVLLCELLEEDYKAHDRYDSALSEAWNTGDGAYRP